MGTSNDTRNDNLREKFLNDFEKITDKMLAVCKAKNSDYSGDSPDPFANFSSVEERRICSTEAGFLTRINDKFSRIISLTNSKGPKVKDESVEDTLLDLANYSILMLCYLRSKR